MASAHRKKIGEIVKRLASVSGITQAELARRVGIQASHLNIFLQGKGDVHSERLLDILMELGIDVESLIEGQILQRQGAAATGSLGSGDLAARIRKMPKAEMEAISLIIGKITREQRKLRLNGKGATR